MKRPIGGDYSAQKLDEEIAARDAPSPMEAVLGLLYTNKGAVTDLQKGFLMMR